jgi:hypothetical protein
MQTFNQQNAKKTARKGSEFPVVSSTSYRRSPAVNHMIAICLLWSIGLFSSCVTISPATVALSSQVGERITEMEQLHQLAIQRYFDVEEQKVKDFMANEWEPLFLKNYLAESNILAELDSASVISQSTQGAIREALKSYLTDPAEASQATDALIKRLSSSRSGEVAQIEELLRQYVEDKQLPAAVVHVNTLLGTDEPARIILEFAEEAHKTMQAQRDTLLAPVRSAREEVTAELSAAYADLVRGQSVITGRLDAARKNSELQTAMLNSVRSGEIYQQFMDRAAKLGEQVQTAIEKAKASLKDDDANK